MIRLDGVRPPRAAAAIPPLTVMALTSAPAALRRTRLVPLCSTSLGDLLAAALMFFSLLPGVGEPDARAERDAELAGHGVDPTAGALEATGAPRFS
jgi:hypothetical protein